MSRRLGSGGRASIDWRLPVVGGVLAIGLVVLLMVLLFGGGGSPVVGVGTQQVDDGRGHIAEGTAGGPYHSVPATSGKHWPTPADWGIYSNPVPQERFLHNLEHGGIVIVYQPAKVSASDLQALTTYVQQQVTTERFKVILTPWGGANFGHSVAVVGWQWLLYLDSADTDGIRAFVDAHYGKAPEPFGGPGRPGG